MMRGSLAVLTSIVVAAAIALHARRCSDDHESGTNAVGEAKSRSVDGGTTSASGASTGEQPTKLPRDPVNPVVALVRDKLKSITIPVVVFEDTSVEEALDFLRLRTLELDPDPEPTRRGLAMATRDSSEARPGRGLADHTAFSRSISIETDNISAWNLLHRIADESGMVVRIRDTGVVELADIPSSIPRTEE